MPVSMDQTTRPDEEVLLTRVEAAKLLHLSPATLATWASRGKADAPPMRKHGGKPIYAKAELLRWSEQRRV
jgi:hypothetical protein